MSLYEAVIPYFPTIKYVSFQRGVLRMLVRGDCPGCDEPIIRNICNLKFAYYCHECLKLCFHVIDTVIPVTTHAANVEEVVE